MSDVSDLIPDESLAEASGGHSTDVIPASALSEPSARAQPVQNRQPTTWGGAAREELSNAGEGLGVIKRHPFSFPVGMMEGGLSSFTHGLGSIADAARQFHASDPGSYAEQWTYQPRTEVGKEWAAANAKEGDLQSRVYDKSFGTGPLATTIKEYGSEALSATGTVAAAGGMAMGAGNLWKQAHAQPQIEAGHPLTEAAQKSQAAIEAHRQGAAEAGVPITPRQISPAQRFLNNSANEDLNLPKNSAVTSDLIDDGIKQNVEPKWKAVRATPAYDIGKLPKYQQAVSKVDLTKIDPEWRPPTSGAMDGNKVADFSTQLRSVARGEFEDAENMNLTYAQRQAARKSAQAHYGAAKAVETGFREAAGDKAANAMDEARIYQAKAESWRGALDGAGNVIGTKVKKLMLADEPISGPMQRAATVVASDPEQFKSTRISTPGPGVVKKAAGALAPTAGAAVGTLAGGPAGAAIGALAGEHVRSKILGK